MTRLRTTGVIAMLFVLVQVAAGCVRKEATDRFDRKALDEFLRPLITRQMEVEHVPGAAVAVVHRGTVVYASGFGVADVESKTPVEVERTIFRIGSISKAVTAVAVVGLADRGEIRLDDDVNKHVKLFTLDNRFPQSVTVEHLLTHTGGFDQPGYHRNFTSKSERPSLVEFLKRDLHRIRPPGRVPCYDTYGISLAGHLLECVSGNSYSDYMRTRLFEPLGMTRTHVECPENLRNDLAAGYAYRDGGYVRQKYEYYASTPASSIDSTVGDMARLMIALLGDGSNAHGRILRPEACNNMLRSGFRVHPEVPGFASGFWEEDRNGQRILQHGGTMKGYSTMLYLVPTQQMGMFIALNRDSETGPQTQLANTVAHGLLDRLMDKSTTPPAPKRETVPIDCSRFAGRYISNLYCHTCWEGDGWGPDDEATKIECVGPGLIRTSTREYRAVAPLDFRDSTGKIILAFHEDPSGRISGFSSNVQSPGTTNEKLDDRLLDDVLGPDKSTRSTAPLVAIIHRLHERWSEAQEMYEKIVPLVHEGSLPRAAASFFAGTCAFERHDYPRAGGHFRNARIILEVLVRDHTDDGSGLSRYMRRALFYEVGCHARCNDLDSAFQLLDHGVNDLGISRRAVAELFGEHPAFESLRADARAEAFRENE